MGGRGLTDKHMWRTASLVFSLSAAIHGDLLKALGRPITKTAVYIVFTLQNLRCVCFAVAVNLTFCWHTY